MSGVGPMSDVAPVIHSFKGYLRHGLIGACQSLFERVGSSGDAKNAAARGDNLPAHLRRACMKDLNAGNLGCCFEARDGETVFVAAGIAAGTGDDAGGGAGRPTQRCVGKAAHVTLAPSVHFHSSQPAPVARHYG